LGQNHVKTLFEHLQTTNIAGYSFLYYWEFIRSTRKEFFSTIGDVTAEKIGIKNTKLPVDFFDKSKYDI